MPNYYGCLPVFSIAVFTINAGVAALAFDYPYRMMPSLPHQFYDERGGGSYDTGPPLPKFDPKFKSREWDSVQTPENIRFMPKRRQPPVALSVRNEQAADENRHHHTPPRFIVTNKLTTTARTKTPAESSLRHINIANDEDERRLVSTTTFKPNNNVLWLPQNRIKSVLSQRSIDGDTSLNHLVSHAVNIDNGKTRQSPPENRAEMSLPLPVSDDDEEITEEEVPLKRNNNAHVYRTTYYTTDHYPGEDKQTNSAKAEMPHEKTDSNDDELQPRMLQPPPHDDEDDGVADTRWILEDRYRRRTQQQKKQRESVTNVQPPRRSDVSFLHPLVVDDGETGTALVPASSANHVYGDDSEYNDDGQAFVADGHGFDDSDDSMIAEPIVLGSTEYGRRTAAEEDQRITRQEAQPQKAHSGRSGPDAEENSGSVDRELNYETAQTERNRKHPSPERFRKVLSKDEQPGAYVDQFRPIKKFGYESKARGFSERDADSTKNGFTSRQRGYGVHREKQQSNRLPAKAHVE